MQTMGKNEWRGSELAFVTGILPSDRSQRSRIFALHPCYLVLWAFADTVKSPYREGKGIGIGHYEVAAIASERSAVQIRPTAGKQSRRFLHRIMTARERAEAEDRTFAAEGEGEELLPGADGHALFATGRDGDHVA